MFELNPTAELVFTASATVASAFVLKNLTGYSFGIETNNLGKTLSAMVLIFISGTIVKEVKKENNKENKSLLGT